MTYNVFGGTLNPAQSNSKLGKTALVFVQPGAKINTVTVITFILEQRLLRNIRRLSNDDFLFHAFFVIISRVVTIYAY